MGPRRTQVFLIVLFAGAIGVVAAVWNCRSESPAPPVASRERIDTAAPVDSTYEPAPAEIGRSTAPVRESVVRESMRKLDVDRPVANRLPSFPIKSKTPLAKIEPAWIVGHVYDATSGAPIAGVRVATTTEAGALREDRTRPDGSFELRPLVAGVSAVVGAYLDAAPATLAEIPRLSAGEQTFDVRVDRSGTIHGEVVDSETRQGIAFATVTLRQVADKGIRITTKSDVQGRYSFNGMASLRDSTVELRVEQIFRFGTHLRATAGDLLACDGVTLVLGQCCSVVGIVVEANGSPIDGADVRFAPQRKSESDRTPPCVARISSWLVVDRVQKPYAGTKADGMFSFRGAFVHGTPESIEVVTKDGRSLIATIPDCERCGESVRIELKFDALKRPLRGRLTVGGTPVRGTVRWNSATRGAVVETRDDGSFDTLIADDDVTLRGFAPDLATIAERVLKAGADASAACDLDVKVSDRIAGQVVDLDGNGVAGARVKATTERASKAPLPVRSDGAFSFRPSPPGEPDGEAVTDERGRFDLGVRVLVYDHRLTVSDAGGNPCAFAIASPGESSVRLVLTPTSRLR